MVSFLNYGIDESNEEIFLGEEVSEVIFFLFNYKGSFNQFSNIHTYII